MTRFFFTTDEDGERHYIGDRDCKRPEMTREFKVLMSLLDRDLVHTIGYEPKN